MLYSTKDLYGQPLAASDGDVGRVDDVYFDDGSWRMRYLVVDTGNWLFERKVLISPQAIVRGSSGTERLRVDVTRQQVKDSPDVLSREPVSHQFDSTAYESYGLPVYLAGPPGWGLGHFPLVTPPPTPEELEVVDEQRGPNLRSAREVAGYQVHAADGDIGHIEGFIIDDSGWTIRYLIMDTGHWLGGRTVLLPSDRLSRISWSDRSVATEMSRETIRLAPEYDPEVELDDSYERRLAAYYDAELPSLDHS